MLSLALPTNILDGYWLFCGSDNLDKWVVSIKTTSEVRVVATCVLQKLVLPRFGSVRFFDHFGRTMNLTNGSVQANLVNPKPDLWFSSQGGPVPVQQHPNSGPNHIYLKKTNLHAEVEAVVKDGTLFASRVHCEEQNSTTPLAHRKGFI